MTTQLPSPASVLGIRADATLAAPLHGQVTAEAEAEALAALVELLIQLADEADLASAARRVVDELHRYSGCRQLAIGWRRADGGCRLIRISGSSHFDPHSDLGRQLEAALDETVIRGKPTVWPPLQETDRAASLVHQKLAKLAEANELISFPLRDGQDKVVGAILCIDAPAGAARGSLLALAHLAPQALGSQLASLQHRPQTAARRIRSQLVPALRRRPVVIAIGLVVALTLLMVVPTPYQLRCRCEAQPTVRRFVAAPFEGTLEKCLVKPGDLVAAGAVLARLDGRELRWELAGLQAEYNRAAKERDAAMATRNAGAAQIAKLEMERLRLKINLLEDRTSQLEIRSPITGIVVSGDLERAEGAPLTLGQALFEIAPLEQISVEISVPESEVVSVHGGATTRARFDSLPGRTWTADLLTIHPRAEIKDDQNVFVAEILLDNHDGELRPGMKGQARIEGPRRTLGWQWFHKPWRALVRACW